MRLLNIMKASRGAPEHTQAVKGHGGFQRDLRSAKELARVGELGGEG